MPSPAEIAAYVGAAAWLPQIGNVIYRRFVTPRVRIIADRTAEIGFTTLGSIFNVRLALSSDRKDALIDQLSVELRHETGDAHQFVWVGLNETFSEISDSLGNRGVIQRDQPAIALKIPTVALVEKVVRFQEREYQDLHRPVLERSLSHYEYLRKTHDDYRQRTLESKEFYDLLDFYKGWFWWKPGEYSVRFGLISPNGAQLRTADFAFRLTTADVDALRSNLDVAKAYYTNLAMSDVSEYEKQPERWAWRTVSVVRPASQVVVKSGATDKK